MSLFTDASRKVGGVVAAAALFGTLALGSVATAQEATPMPYTPGTDLASLGGKIESDGSSTVAPITEAIAEEFGLAGGNGVEMVINISGTGGGFARFCEGGTDIQNASRSIREEEMATCAENGVDYYEFEVAYDGLSVVVNPANDFVECLTTDQLAMIWGENRAATWNAVNPEWPEEPIVLYGPGTDSGTYDYFVEEILGDTPSTTDYFPSEDDNALVQGVSGDANALGFFGLAYYEQNADSLKLIAVDGGNGCVTPTLETVQDGSYAPLSRPLYVYVKAESLTRPEVQEFMRFYIANVASIAEEVGYVDSPSRVYVEDQNKLEAAIAGAGTPDSQMAGEAEATPES
jgi:phosphate transport system substrate-binding protein